MQFRCGNFPDINAAINGTSDNIGAIRAKKLTKQPAHTLPHSSNYQRSLQGHSMLYGKVQSQTQAIGSNTYRYESDNSTG
jgi:hypothetical protein